MSKRMHRGGASLHGLDDAFEAIGRLWGLRLLRKADVRGICVASVGGLLGIDDDEAFPPPRKCYRIAGQILEGLQSRSIQEPQPLWDNIALLSKVIPLSLEERRFLAFRAVAERYEPLDNLLSAIGNLSDERLARIVATALEIDPAVARGIVARDARLRMSGLISLDEDLVVFSEKVQVVPGLFNALLTQMECFEGLLVCATNRMESLDPAVLRRFHFKVRFAYLTCEQKEECFVAALRDLGYPVERELPPDVRPELWRIRNLTPGDFAAVTEAMRIVGASVSPGQLLRELRKEADLKPEGRRVPPPASCDPGAIVRGGPVF